MQSAFFCCQGQLKYFGENYQICRKSRNHANNRRLVGVMLLRHYEALLTKIDMRLTSKKTRFKVCSLKMKSF